MANQGKGIDLFTLFQGVMGQLQNNKDELNRADDYNHDHGDNMVDTFYMITQAMKEKQGASPAEQLAYASQVLKEKQSGSSRLYADGLSQAAQQFQGQKQVTSNNAMTLIQSLLGGGQAPVKEQQQAGGLGGILGSIFGGGKAAWDQPASGGKPAGEKPASGGKAAWDKPAFGGTAAWNKPAFGGKAAWDKQPENTPTGKDTGTVFTEQDYINSLLAELPPGWKATLDPETGDYRMDTPYGFEPVSPKNLRKYVTWARQDAGLGPTQQATARQQTDAVDNISPGDSALEAIVNTVVSNSASNSGYRQESSSIVARTLMQAIQGFLKK